MVAPSDTIVAPARADAQADTLSPADAHSRFWEIVAGWETRSPGLDDTLGVAARVRSLRDPLADIGQRVVDHAGYGFGAREGRSFFLGISPGMVQLRTEDENRRVRVEDRRRVADADGPVMLAASVGDDGVIPEHKPWGGEIVEWSRKSRSRMYWRILSLDLGGWQDQPGNMGLVTLTLPGDWLAITPTGADFKRLLELLRRRWVRALGPKSWACIWKLEFQDRGAPHWHALMRIPALVKGEPFNDWLSRTWAEVVSADDTLCHGCGEYCSCEVPDTEYRRHLAAGSAVDFPGKDYSDPRRIAVYFLGHSSKHTDGKEYQHVVPLAWRGRGKGPGRFWGYSGIKVALAEVEVTQREHYALARVLRKVKRARDSRLTRARAARGLPARVGRWQASYSLGGRGGIVGGWVAVNDGLLLALDLGRYLHQLRT